MFEEKVQQDMYIAFPRQDRMERRRWGNSFGAVAKVKSDNNGRNVLCFTKSTKVSEYCIAQCLAI